MEVSQDLIIVSPPGGTEAVGTAATIEAPLKLFVIVLCPFPMISGQPAIGVYPEIGGGRP
jgi:hypothetical protein